MPCSLALVLGGPADSGTGACIGAGVSCKGHLPVRSPGHFKGDAGDTVLEAFSFLVRWGPPERLVFGCVTGKGYTLELNGLGASIPHGPQFESWLHHFLSSSLLILLGKQWRMAPTWETWMEPLASAWLDTACGRHLGNDPAGGRPLSPSLAVMPRAGCKGAALPRSLWDESCV